MSDKLEQIQLLFQKRNARKRGPTSSDQYNDMIDEISHDLTEFNSQWNNRLVPITDSLPDGTVDASVDAFANGLDGGSLYTDQNASSTDNSLYWNSPSSRPNTVLEQFDLFYTTMNEIRDDLENQINNTALTAAQISVVDSDGLYVASEVESALAEAMSKINNLELLSFGGVGEDIIPSVDNTFNIGSTARRWKQVYVAPASLHIWANASEADGTARDYKLTVDSTAHGDDNSGAFQLQDGSNVLLRLTPGGGLQIPEINPSPAPDALTGFGTLYVSNVDKKLYLRGSDGVITEVGSGTTQYNELIIGADSNNDEASSNIQFHVDGTEFWRVGTLGALRAQQSTSYFRGTYGDATTPGISFESDNDVGVFRGSTPIRLGFSVSGTERANINEGGYLGIGITDASTALHVMGTGPNATRLTLERHQDSNTSDANIIFKSSRGTISGGVATPAARQDGDRVGALFFYGHDGAAWQNAGVIRVNVDGTVGSGYVPGELNFLLADSAGSLESRMMIRADGKVGIGTNIPEHELSLFKDKNASSTQFGIDNLDQRLVLNAYYESGVTQYASIQSSDNAETSFMPLILNRSGGNVGIGVVGNPSNKLEINGSGEVSIGLHSTASGQTSKIEIGEGGTGNRYAHIDLVGDDTYSDYGLRVLRANTGPNANSEIDHRGTGGLYLQCVDAGFIGFNISSSEKMRVHSNGYVGIGTDLPNYILHVRKTGDSILTVEGSTAAFLRMFDQGAGADLKYVDVVTNDGTFVVRSLNDDFSIKDTLIGSTAAGNVGIGFASPLEKFHVHDSYDLPDTINSEQTIAWITGDAGGGDPHGLRFSSRRLVARTTGVHVSTAGIRMAWAPSPGDASSNGGRCWYEMGNVLENNLAAHVHAWGFDAQEGSAGTELMRLTSAGLGIGITGPESPLHVVYPGATSPAGPSGTWAAKIEMFQDTAAYNGLTVTNRWRGTGSKIFEVGSFYTPGVGETYDPLFTINGAGYTGIGTDAPAQLLHVYGTTAATIKVQADTTPWVAGLSIQSGAGAGESAGLYSYGTTGEVRHFANTNYWLSFYTHGSEAMRLDVNGKLGIGGTPESRLNVFESGGVGGLLNDVRLITTVQATTGAGTGNNFINRTWLRRDAAGSDWTTLRLHDGLSIDSSFLTPGTDTRCWIERDPNTQAFFFGSGGDTYLDFNSTALYFQGDTDAYFWLGRVKLGYDGSGGDQAAFAHFDHFNSTNYALRQNPDGTTVVNCSSASAVYLATGGTGRWYLDGTTGNFVANGTYQILADDASSGSATPGYSFIGDTNTGMYQIAADQVGISCGGVGILQMSNDNVAINAAPPSATKLYVYAPEAPGGSSNGIQLTFWPGGAGSGNQTAHNTWFVPRHSSGTFGDCNAHWIDFSFEHDSPAHIDNAYIFHTQFRSYAASGSITNAFVFQYQDGGDYTVGGGPPTITNHYGIYLNNINRGTTLNYAIYTNAGKVRFGDDVYATNKLAVGTTSIPQGGIGYAKIALHGTSGATGPHIQATTTEDDYPVYQQLHYYHDNIAMHFDCYYDGAFKSSDAGSNFQFYKISDKFQIRYDSGVAQGGTITWNDGIVLDTAGTVSMPAMQQYYSIYLSGATASSAVAYNPFDSDNSGTIVSRANNGITYTASTGRFTVAYAGTYEITYTANIQQGGSTATTDYFITVNGSTIFAGIANLLDTSDIEAFTASVIYDLTASQYIEVWVDGTTNVICHPGTCLTIKRIA